MKGGNVGRGEDTGTVEDGINFLAEGDLGRRVNVLDEGESRVESYFWGGWGRVPNTQRVDSVRSWSLGGRG